MKLVDALRRVDKSEDTIPRVGIGSIISHLRVCAMPWV